jgi:DNA-binding transcriptional LysR family regulator
MLKMSQLRQFAIAASSGSFKDAATATFRSQAAVSIAMRELERAIGGELIERDQRGKFTPLARAVLPLFQELLTLHDLVLARSRQLAEGDHGSVAIAVAPFLAERWLPDLIAEFAEKHPGIRIRTVEESSSRIRALVADGTVDIGVAGMLQEDLTLTVRPVANDSYGVLCSRHHPLARRSATPWSSLRTERIIGSDASEALVAAGRAPPLPPADLVITSRAPLLACVRRNLGVAILPMLTRPGPMDGLAFVPLTRPTLARTVAIMTRSSESLLPAGQRLVAMLAESLHHFALGRGAIPARRRARAGHGGFAAAD